MNKSIQTRNYATIVNAPQSHKASRSNSNKTFRRHKQQINQALCMAIANRNISVRVRDICKAANITSPTFYQHYHNCNDALEICEAEIEHEFIKFIEVVTNEPEIVPNPEHGFDPSHRQKPITNHGIASKHKLESTTVNDAATVDNHPLHHPNKQVALNLLLIFIHRHRTYFEANFLNHHLFLLTKLFIILRPLLVPDTISDRNYGFYLTNLETIILYWFTYDNLDKSAIPTYLQQMNRMKVMEW